MAKTKGGFTFSTGRNPASPADIAKARDNSKREERRSTRVHQKSADLGIASKTKMKTKGASTRSKKKTAESVAIPESQPQEASSSNPPIQNPKVSATNLLFRNSKLTKRYHSVMMDKTIVFGKSVDPLLFIKSGITSLFERVGLYNMLSPSPIAYPILIKQFYGNMTVDSNKFETLVQDKLISVDETLLGKILHIPYLGVCPFTLKGPYEFENFKITDQIRTVKGCETSEFVSLPKVVDTTPVNSVIHKLIRANLIPRSGGRSDMTFQDLILSSMIQKGIKFNFALMMIKHMESCLINKSKCFPYGGFITPILKYFNISFELEEFVSITEVIDDEVFTNSKIGINDDGTLFWNVHEPTTVFASPSENLNEPHLEPLVSSPPTTDDHFPSSSLPHSNPSNLEILQLMQTMITKMDSFMETINVVLESVDTVSARVDTLLARQNDHEAKLSAMDKKTDEAFF